MESCDVFFYNVGMRLGIDRLSYYGSELGIGHKTGIDLPSEEPGLMPSEEWVEKTFHRKWYAGETISVSTGQGAVTTTPLQLARMIGGIASGGVFKQPHLLKDAQNVGEERFAISEPTVEKITDAMYAVVNERAARAAHSNLPALNSAENREPPRSSATRTRERLGKQKKFEDNAWFVGYAPRAIRKSSSPSSSRKAANTVEQRPVLSPATSSRRITIRRTRSWTGRSRPTAHNLIRPGTRRQQRPFSPSRS